MTERADNAAAIARWAAIPPETVNGYDDEGGFPKCHLIITQLPDRGALPLRRVSVA